MRLKYRFPWKNHETEAPEDQHIKLLFLMLKKGINVEVKDEMDKSLTELYFTFFRVYVIFSSRKATPRGSREDERWRADVNYCYLYSVGAQHCIARERTNYG